MLSNKLSKSKMFKPVGEIDRLGTYKVSQAVTPVDIFLNGNEGNKNLPEDINSRISELLGDAELIRKYPDSAALEKKIAERHNVLPAQVLVTAGGDEALDRICRLALEPGRNVIMPAPTFGMLDHFARLAGGSVRTFDWLRNSFPTEAVIDLIDSDTSLIIIVSPNNPTGAVATADDIRQIADAAPSALVLVDLAYVEFADEDPTGALLSIENCAVVRTFSKAWGLAGLRVGYVLGSSKIIEWLRKTGTPFSVASVSLALTAAAINSERVMTTYVREIKENRIFLIDALSKLGAQPLDSQGNFVLARFKDSKLVYQGLVGMGIIVRSYFSNPLLSDYLRTTVPPADQLKRLLFALQTVLKPELILFDMDGVLADVSQSYRQAIIQTAKAFGINITAEEINRYKQQGNCNNDWQLTEQIMKNHGSDVSFEKIKERFEVIYQGNNATPGLWENETLLIAPDILQQLADKINLGIVTGRPRRDARRFLSKYKLSDLFETVVCLEDANQKPSPQPLTLAMKNVGAKRAWMIGDTPDDIRAARAAAVLPLGIVAPGDDESSGRCLLESGAGQILKSLNQLTELIS